MAKYPIGIWVLGFFKFNTCVLICFIGSTWVRSENPLGTSVNLIKKKWKKKLKKIKKKKTKKKKRRGLAHHGGGLSHPLGRSRVAELPHRGWFGHPMAKKIKNKK
jgi:hypothetical protein